MTVDEILADPAASLDLPSDSVPIHVIVIIDYVNPADGKRYLTARGDEQLPHWTMRGMLEEAHELIEICTPYVIETPGEDE